MEVVSRSVQFAVEVVGTVSLGRCALGQYVQRLHPTQIRLHLRLRPHPLQIRVVGKIRFRFLPPSSLRLS